MAIFLNRKTITMINCLREKYGSRMAQTNSRHNGNFSTIRIYDKPEDRGHINRAILTIDNHRDLRMAVETKAL